MAHVVDYFKHLTTDKVALLGQLRDLNDFLLNRTFLVGERLSSSDIQTASILLPVFQHVFDADAEKKLVNLTRWFKTVINQPNVKEVLGDIKLGEKSNLESKLRDLVSKLGKATIKEEKPKKEQPKKEEKKPAAKPKAEDADDDDAPKESSKDPFADMPKGTFVMDTFKRVYSNEDTAAKAIPHFWENFDGDNYSIWKCEYKYPQDLTQVFMSCNLISGMFQRLEKLKKNAFASMILFGSNNDSTISGIWVWRGQELVFPLCPDWQVDYESYEWTKLDPKDEKNRKTVNEYLLHEGDFDGKKFNQGKIFK